MTVAKIALWNTMMERDMRKADLCRLLGVPRHKGSTGRLPAHIQYGAARVCLRRLGQAPGGFGGSGVAISPAPYAMPSARSKEAGRKLDV